MKISFYLFIY